MAIKAAPVVSEPLYLQDFNKQVKEWEKDDDPEDRAWVKVRQATELDEMEINSMTSKSTMRWTDGGSAEQVNTVNPREVRALEVYRTLVDAGNILNANGDGPLFDFEGDGFHRKVKGGFKAFKTAYGSLPAEVTTAILRAVYKINPGWDWMAPRGESEEQE